MIMKNGKYDIWLTITAVAAAVTLILGCVCAIFSQLKTSIVARSADVSTDNVAEFESIIDTTEPESYSSLIGAMVDLRYEYSETLKFFTAGYSEAGKEIPMLTMGTGQKKAVIIGGIHAREHITTKYLLRVVEDYCYANEKGDGYIGLFDIKNLLSEYTIYVLPCVNPDGLEIIRGREKAAKGVKISDMEEYKANRNGVDLNRNFPLAWENIKNGVKTPTTHFFKGYAPADQKETQVLMKLCEENNFVFALSIHIKGNCIFWGDTYNTSNNALYKAFAQDIVEASGLNMTEPTFKANSYGGGFENWFRHTYSRPGQCIELSDYTNIISPCDDKNYKDFNGFINYDESKYALAAAMQSDSM